MHQNICNDVYACVKSLPSFSISLPRFLSLQKLPNLMMMTGTEQASQRTCVHTIDQRVRETKIAGMRTHGREEGGVRVANTATKIALKCKVALSSVKMKRNGSPTC